MKKLLENDYHVDVFAGRFVWHWQLVYRHSNVVKHRSTCVTLAHGWALSYESARRKGRKAYRKLINSGTRTQTSR